MIELPSYKRIKKWICIRGYKSTPPVYLQSFEKYNKQSYLLGVYPYGFNTSIDLQINQTTSSLAQQEVGNNQANIQH